MPPRLRAGDDGCMVCFTAPRCASGPGRSSMTMTAVACPPRRTFGRIVPEACRARPTRLTLRRPTLDAPPPEDFPGGVVVVGPRSPPPLMRVNAKGRASIRSAFHRTSSPAGDSFRRSPDDGTGLPRSSCVDRGGRFPQLPGPRAELPMKAAWNVHAVSRCEVTPVGDFARPRPLARPARGGWASPHRPCGPCARCPDVRVARVSSRETCPSMRRFGFPRRGMSRARTSSSDFCRNYDRGHEPSKAWTSQRPLAARARSRAASQRVRCGMPGAVPDIGFSGRARRFHAALRPRMRAASPRTSHRLSTTRRAPEASGPWSSRRGTPPWVRWDRAPLGTNARSLSPASVRTRVGISLQIRRLDRRLA